MPFFSLSFVPTLHCWTSKSEITSALYVYQLFLSCYGYFPILLGHVREEATWVCDNKSHRSWKGGLRCKWPEKLKLVAS